MANIDEKQTVEALVELFQCGVCMDKLRNPHLCPHCSKLCCYQCIRRCLADQPKCPHCRVPLRLRDLIKCRWGEEVTRQVNALHTLYGRMDKETMCEDHALPMLVYCETCDMCLCHQDALYGGAHKGHDFKTTEEVAKKNELYLRNMMAMTTKYINDCMNKVKTKATHMQYAKDMALQAVDEAMELQLSAKLKLLEAQQTVVASAARQATLMQRKVDGYSAQEMISKRESTRKEINMNKRMLQHPGLLTPMEPNFLGGDVGLPSLFIRCTFPNIPTPPPATLSAATRRWASSPDVSGVN